MEIQFRADALEDQLKTKQLIAQEAEVFPIHGLNKIVSVSPYRILYDKKCFHSSRKLWAITHCAQRIFLHLGV